MKKQCKQFGYFMGLFAALMILVSSIAVAGGSEKVMDKQAMSEVSDKLSNKPVVSEEVSCIFLSPTSSQVCVSNKGSCTAYIPKCNSKDAKCLLPSYISCTVKVKGFMGQKVEWKSTCGGIGYSLMDGVSEKVNFKCDAQVSEKVTCHFADSKKIEKCYSRDGKYSCSGRGSCSLWVSEPQGTIMGWKSSCGGMGKTLVDGNDDEIFFSCLQHLSNTTNFIDSTTVINNDSKVTG